MKTVKWLEPFAGMTGNVTGAQELVYPTKDNKAWEAPEGKNYAQNYTSRYIVYQRKSDGRYYFGVKKKTAVRINADTKMTMAVLGGFGAIYAAIMKDNSLKTALTNLYLPQSAAGAFSGTFREFCAERIMPMLQNRQVAAAFPAYTMPGGIVVPSVTIRSPWFETAVIGSEVTISKNIVVKFWTELAGGGEYFVGKHRGILPVGAVGQTWEDITTASFKGVSGWYNIIPITAPEGGNVKYYEQYVLQSPGVYAESSDEPAANAHYGLTYTAPEP